MVRRLDREAFQDLALGDAAAAVESAATEVVDTEVQEEERRAPQGVRDVVARKFSCAAFLRCGGHCEFDHSHLPFPASRALAAQEPDSRVGLHFLMAFIF